MRHTITLRKWSAILDREDAKKFQINPGFIVSVEELSPRSDKNIGARTRLDYVLPGMAVQSILVWESSEQIDALVAVAREAMRQALIMRSEGTNVEAKNDSASS